MFRHLLVPTDGSALSAKSARNAVRLARALGARVTGLYVASAYASREYMPAVASRKLKGIFEREAGRALAPLTAASKAAGVICSTPPSA